MKQTIWKYELIASDAQIISLPRGCDVLTVQVQRGVPCIWVMVNPDEKVLYDHLFHIYGTGQVVTASDRPETYIGTFQLENGAMVFHVFEVM